MESHYKYKLEQQLAQFKKQFEISLGDGNELISPNRKEMDLKVICTNGEFYCHKKILLSSSNFFKQMNEIFTDVSEFDCSNGEIKCSIDCMKSIVLVLYGEQIPTIEIKFRHYKIVNDPIKLHMEMAYMMDILDFVSYVKNDILQKVMNAKILFFRESNSYKPLVINYNSAYYDELTTEQLYMVKGLSFKSIYNIVNSYNIHKNRYMKYMRNVLLFLSVDYYSEDIINKYCREYQHSPKMLRKSDIIANDDIDEDIRDEYVMAHYIYNATNH